MKIWRILLAAIVLAAGLLLSSCMNLQQEIWFNPDGTGKQNVDIGFSESMMGLMALSGGGTSMPTEEDIKQLLSSSGMQNANGMEYVKSTDFNSYKKDSYVHYVVSLDVKDMQNYLSSSQQYSAGSAMTLEKLPNGNYLFKQSVNMNEALGLNNSQSPYNNMDMASLVGPTFEGQYYNLKIYVPTVVRTNGTQDIFGGYVEWKFPMKDLFSSEGYEISLEFNYQPAWMGLIPYFAMGLFVLFVAVGTVIYVFKQRSAATASEEPVDLAEPVEPGVLAESADLPVSPELRELAEPTAAEELAEPVSETPAEPAPPSPDEPIPMPGNSSSPHF